MSSSPSRTYELWRPDTSTYNNNPTSSQNIKQWKKYKDLTKRQQQQSSYYNRIAQESPTLAEGDIIRMKPFPPRRQSVQERNGNF